MDAHYKLRRILNLVLYTQRKLFFLFVVVVFSLHFFPYSTPFPRWAYSAQWCIWRITFVCRFFIGWTACRDSIHSLGNRLLKPHETHTPRAAEREMQTQFGWKCITLLMIDFFYFILNQFQTVFGPVNYELFFFLLNWLHFLFSDLQTHRGNQLWLFCVTANSIQIAHDKIKYLNNEFFSLHFIFCLLFCHMVMHF